MGFPALHYVSGSYVYDHPTLTHPLLGWLSVMVNDSVIGLAAFGGMLWLRPIHSNIFRIISCASCSVMVTVTPGVLVILIAVPFYR